MSKHTPGPWQLARFNPDTCHIELETVERGDDVPSQGYTLGKLYAGPDGPTADNLLIAAAPDLLEALQECVTENGAYCLRTNTVESLRTRLDAITEIARAAIAKATGE